MRVERKNLQYENCFSLRKLNWDAGEKNMGFNSTLNEPKEISCRFNRLISI